MKPRRGPLRPLRWARAAAVMTAGAALSLVYHVAGAPDLVAVLAGVLLACVLWRPPPASTSALARNSLTSAAETHVCDLGRVVTAPTVLLPVVVPGQRFCLATSELQRHVTLIGATGSGKTTTAARLIDTAVACQWPVLVIDAKGGRLSSICAYVARRHDVPMRAWQPDRPDTWTYNPCDGTPGAVANRLVGAFEHGRDGQIYRNLSQALIPIVIQSLIETDQTCTLDSLRFSLDSAHLAGLARRLTDPTVKAELVSMLHDELHRRALSGLVGRLRSLRLGAFGSALMPSERTLDLASCLSTPGITYFGLPATAASEDVVLVGRVLIQHVKQQVYDGLWSAQRRPGLIVIDEFASLGDAVQLADLLLQAREAALAVVVCTQQLPRDAVLRKALLGAGILIAHQIGAPEDADVVARSLGTRTASEVARTVQLGPGGPVVRRLLRPRDAFLVSPDALTRLPVGQAAVNVRFASQRIALVQVDPLPFLHAEPEHYELE